MAVGYGRDLSCLNALVTGRMVGGKTLLVQAIVRRLTTPRGTLRGSAEASRYGIDLAGYVGQVGDAVAAAALPAVIESELLKDDRIASVAVAVTYTRDAAGLVTYLVRIDVTPASELEDFALTLAVSDVTVSMIGGMS